MDCFEVDLWDVFTNTSLVKNKVAIYSLGHTRGHTIGHILRSICTLLRVLKDLEMYKNNVTLLPLNKKLKVGQGINFNNIDADLFEIISFVNFKN